MAKQPKNDGSDSMTTGDMLRVRADREQENSEHPLGKVLHLNTVTHGFRGILAHVSETHYYLAKAHMVNGTGKIASYFAAGLAKGEEESPELPGIVRVPRGAVAWEAVVDESYCARYLASVG